MNLELKIPAVAVSYENANTVISIANSIRAKYGSVIDSVAAITTVPNYIILGFIFVESKGDPNAISGKSVGLMQINPDTAIVALIRENINKQLTGEKLELCKQYLGTRLNVILSKKFTWQTAPGAITKADLLNPEFNILVASIYLNQLMLKTKEGNVLRLDKVIWLYNRGEFSKIPAGGPANVYANAGSVTGKYLRMLLGEKGVLDQLT